MMNKENKLPDGWAITRLEDVAKRITKGSTPTTYGYSFQKSGINFIKVENISEGRVNLKSITDFISEDAHEFQSKSKLCINDILFSIAGTIGETCVIREEYLPANTNQALAIIKGTDKAIIPKLLQLQLETFVARVKLKARGGAMSNVSLEDLKKLLIYLPPLPEQHRIVAKIEELFSRLDKGIESLKNARQQLKVYRQAVLKWAFEGKLTKSLNGDSSDVCDEHDAEATQNQTNHNNHKNQGADNLPKGWVFAALGDIISISSGTGLTKANRTDEGDYLVYGGNGVTGKHKEYLFEEEKLIIGRVGVHCGNTHITKPKSWITDNAFIVSFDEESIDMKFLYYLLKDCNLNKYASSTAQPVISQGKIYPVKVAYPKNKSEQHHIVSEIEKRLSVADKLEEAIATALQQAEALRQSILKKAFEGKLVPQDPNDEPASVLLERIKAEQEANQKAKAPKKSITSKQS